MTTLKVIFCPSKKNPEEGNITYHITHNRHYKKWGTDYHLFTNEWNGQSYQQLFNIHDPQRLPYLQEVAIKLRRDLLNIERAINDLEKQQTEYNIPDILKQTHLIQEQQSFFSFAEKIIKEKQGLGKIRTSETYAAAIKSFRQFYGEEDLYFEDITHQLIEKYENHLKNKGLCPNSTSFYMRNLRTLYNKAVDEDLCIQNRPFRHVYTGIAKTAKRAIDIPFMKKIKDLDLTTNPDLEFARDLFLFSFYCRGMSFIDMAYLKKTDLTHDIITYKRKKTGQQLSIKCEECLKKLIKKYEIKDSPYLLPIIKQNSRNDERTQYILAQARINKAIKEVGKLVGSKHPLTLYVARHSWASIAKSKDVPISIISAGMGHESEKTTEIYLTSLTRIQLDKINRIIIQSVK